MVAKFSAHKKAFSKRDQFAGRIGGIQPLYCLSGVCQQLCDAGDEDEFCGQAGGFKEFLKRNHIEIAESAELNL